MTDHALALQTITFAGFHPGVAESEPTVAIPTEPGRTTRWQCVVVDMSGGPVAVIPVLGNPIVTWPLDLPVMATFKIRFDDAAPLPLPNRLTVPPREVQLYRNGHLILWGPVVARRGGTDARVWEYTAYDPLWYLQHRFFGEAARRNYLANGSFEVDLAGWTGAGTVTATQTTARAILGTGSMKLVTALEGDNYRFARFPMTSGALGVALYFTMWVFVESYLGPALGGRGIYIERQSSPGVRKTDLKSWAMTPLDENTAPIGKWSRMSVVVEMPPNVTETIEVRCYAPHGTAYYDAGTVTVPESVSMVIGNSAGGLGWDQTTIAQQIVRYLSGVWPVGANYTKSDLRIAVAGPASGVTKERTYQFSDHQNGFDALTEFTKSSDGFDFRIECTPTSRVFRTYYPSVGAVWNQPFVYRRADDLGRNRSWGITSVDAGESIEGSASDITEYGGWGTGSGREEAAFSDTAAFGGLTLEYIEAAPTEAPIDLLNSIVASRGAQLAKPLATPTLTMVEPRDPVTQQVILPLIGVLMPGDVLQNLTVDDASLQLAGPVRVAQIVLNEDETLSVMVN